MDGGWMDGYPLDCYDYQSTCGVDPVENTHIAVILDGKYVSKTQNPNIVPEKNYPVGK